MVEDAKKGWRKWAFLGAFLASIGLSKANHNNEPINKTQTTNTTVKPILTDENKIEKTFLIEIHKSFQSTNFYDNIEKYGFENISKDFDFVFNTVLKDNISSEEITLLVNSLKKIISISEQLNAKYFYLANKNPTSKEMSLYQKNLNFYKQFSFKDYVSAIQSLLKKNKHYSQFSDSPQYQILNLHAFVGIHKNL